MHYWQSKVLCRLLGQSHIAFLTTAALNLWLLRRWHIDQAESPKCFKTLPDNTVDRNCLLKDPLVVSPQKPIPNQKLFQMNFIVNILSNVWEPLPCFSISESATVTHSSSYGFSRTSTPMNRYMANVVSLYLYKKVIPVPIKRVSCCALSLGLTSSKRTKKVR